MQDYTQSLDTAVKLPGTLGMIEPDEPPAPKCHTSRFTPTLSISSPADMAVGRSQNRRLSRSFDSSLMGSGSLGNNRCPSKSDHALTRQSLWPANRYRPLGVVVNPCIVRQAVDHNENEQDHCETN